MSSSLTILKLSTRLFISVVTSYPVEATVGIVIATAGYRRPQIVIRRIPDLGFSAGICALNLTRTHRIPKQ